MNRGVNAIVWAMNARGISPTAFRLLMQMCSYVNGSDPDRADYDVWPSKTELAERCEISTSGVKRHLKELVDAGYIEVSAWQTEHGSTTTNTYTICVASAHGMPGGRIVRSGKPVGVQSDPLVQSEPGRGSGLNPAGFTAEPCKEPSNRTFELEDSPPSLREGQPPADLLSDIPVSHALVPARGSLIDYVAERWQQLSTDFPRIQSVRVWNDSRKKKIAARAAEFVRSAKGEVDAYEVWDMIFASIRGDVWLRGEAEPGRGYSRAYAVEIDHVLRPAGNPNFMTILERASTDDQNNRVTSDPTSGRRLGPAEQSAHAALALVRAARERRGG